MSHRNARLTPAGRRILVERIISGRPVAHVAKEMGISRTCGSNPWLSEDSPSKRSWKTGSRKSAPLSRQ
jgi:hypothetical protein